MDWFKDLNEKQRIIAAKVMDAAEKHGVDPEYALATAMAESKLNPAAVSRDKEGNPIAYGVMQLRPGTAKDLKANHLDEDQNIDAGVRYLKQMVDKTGGDKQLASVAYNAGPNSDFFTSGKVPAESEEYVKRIHGYGGYGSAAAPESLAQADTITEDQQGNEIPQPAMSVPAEAVDDTTDLTYPQLGATALGAVAGGYNAPHAKLSDERVNQIDRVQRQKIKEVEDANAATRRQNAALEAEHANALEMRNKAIEATRKAQEPVGLEKYAISQAREGSPVPKVVLSNPNVLTNADVQAGLPSAAAAQRKATTLFPGEATTFDPARGFYVPHTVAPAPGPAPIETHFPMPQRPQLSPERAVPAWKETYPGHRGGRTLGIVGGGMAGAQGVDAAERAANADPVGAGLAALSAAGAGATQSKNPKRAAVGAAGAVGADILKNIWDYYRPEPEQKSVLQKAKGGLATLPHYAGAKESLVKKALGAAEGPLNRIAEYAHKAFDPRFDERVLEQGKLAALRPRVEQTGAQNVPTVSLADFEGRPFITSMADRTAAGGNLLGVNGSNFNRPVALKGGQDYMFNNPGQVWASAKGPTGQIMRTASALRDFTGHDPLYIPWRMAPSGGDFAHMTGQAMLAQAETGLNKTQKRMLDKQLKSIIPDWQGIDHPSSFDQFAMAPSAARKAAQNLLDKNFRDVGGLGLGEARLAVADPKQVAAPEGGLMNVGRVFSDKPMIATSGHESYPFAIPGEGLGRLDKELQVYQMLPEAAKTRGMGDVMQPSQSDLRALQMKPYAGIIDDKLLKSLGY